MPEVFYVPGDTTVLLHVDVLDNATPANNPITGLTVHASIRRLSDNKWWDTTNSEWDTVAYGALTTDHQIALADRGDGSYEATWNQATADSSAVRSYVVVYRVTAGLGWVGSEAQDTLTPVVQETLTDLGWTAALASRLSRLYIGAWTVVSAVNDGDPVYCLVTVTETVPGTLHGLNGATAIWLTGTNVGVGPSRVYDSTSVKGSNKIYLYPAPPTLPVAGETFALYALGYAEEYDPLVSSDIATDLDGFVRIKTWTPIIEWQSVATPGQTIRWAVRPQATSPFDAIEWSVDAHYTLSRLRDGVSTEIVGEGPPTTPIETDATLTYPLAWVDIDLADWQAGDELLLKIHALAILVNAEQAVWIATGHADAQAQYRCVIVEDNPAAGAGTGENTVTFMVTDAVTDAVISGARLKIYTDAARTTKTAENTTATDGTGPVFLDDGTYYYAVTSGGYVTATGTVVVDGNEAVAVALSEFSVGAATDPTQRRVYLRLQDIQGDYPATAANKRPTFKVRLKNAVLYGTDSTIALSELKSIEAEDNESSYLDLLPTDDMTALDTNLPIEYEAQIMAARLTFSFELPTGDLSSVALMSLRS